MGAEPPGTDPPQGFDFDDHELDQLIADWEAVDRQAVRVLRDALAGTPHRSGRLDAAEVARLRLGLGLRRGGLLVS